MSIWLKESDEVVLEIPENENIVQIKYSNKTFLIYPPKEFEVDGIYQEFKWDELEFDGDEIKVLFDNTNFNKYPNSIIEVKLSAYKIDELIQQLKTDQIICEHMVNKNSVYIGFLNLTKVIFILLELMIIQKFAVICRALFLELIMEHFANEI